MNRPSVDIDLLRAQTPGCSEVVHLNNAGASLPPAVVVDTVVQYLREESLVGGYELADRRAGELAEVYRSVAGVVGANEDEIALLDSATRAWDMAFYSLRFAEGDRILTTTTEYAANFIAYLQVAARTGAVVEVVPDAPSGEIDIEALEDMMDERVSLISINHVPTNSGLVNPAAEVGRIARDAGAIYLLDACQSIGQMPIDVDEVGCDLLSATSRKYLRGPRGVGFLYVRDTLIEDLDPVSLDLHSATWTEPDKFEVRSDAKRFETWESSPALRLGLGAACRYATDLGLDLIWGRLSMLADLLRRSLQTVPGITVHDKGRVKGGIVTFSVDGHSAAAVQQELAKHQINVSMTSVFSARIDMEQRGLDEVIRSSVHYFNTEDEITTTVGVIERLVKGG
ncbi:MAG: aminotransferase class V-fold PLP-dependent enzyme [Acidimicrobiia bacterium]|nr:aminotransferase class V-fold PLP-dependent enzyme [Acidimicrobiia bacterium]